MQPSHLAAVTPFLELARMILTPPTSDGFGRGSLSLLINSVKMFSQFIRQSIDNFFHDKPSPHKEQPQTLDNSTLKKDYTQVIRSKRDISQSRIVKADNPVSKSRLKMYLESDRETKLDNVIKRTDTNKSRVLGKSNIRPSVPFEERREEGRSVTPRQKENLQEVVSYRRTSIFPKESSNKQAGFPTRLSRPQLY